MLQGDFFIFVLDNEVIGAEAEFFLVFGLVKDDLFVSEIRK